jgi:hypothetical protein
LLYIFPTGSGRDTGKKTNPTVLPVKGLSCLKSEFFKNKYNKNSMEENMKTKKFDKKLLLNKETVADLGGDMKAVYGGVINTKYATACVTNCRLCPTVPYTEIQTVCDNDCNTTTADTRCC